MQNARRRFRAFALSWETPSVWLTAFNDFQAGRPQLVAVLLQASEVGERPFLGFDRLAVSAHVVAARRPLFRRSHFLRFFCLSLRHREKRKEQRNQGEASGHRLTPFQTTYISIKSINWRELRRIWA